MLVASAAEHDRECTQDDRRLPRANGHVLFVGTADELDREIWDPFKTLTLQQCNQHYRSDGNLADISWIRLLQNFSKRECIGLDGLSIQTTLQFGSQLLTPKSIVIIC